MNATDTATDARKPSWFPIDNVVIEDFNLTPYEGWLYAVIVKFANRKTGEAFPSHAALAKAANMSKSNVIRCIASLEAKRLIHVERSRKPGKREKAVNHYVILDPRQPEVGSVSQTLGSVSQTLGVVSDSDYNNNQLNNTKEQLQQPTPDESDPTPPLSEQVVVISSKETQNKRNGNKAKTVPSATPAPPADPAFGELVRAYEADIGIITPTTRDLLIEDFDTYPHEWLHAAISIAVLQNNRRWSYVRGILKRWAVDGKDAPRAGAAPVAPPHIPPGVRDCPMCGGTGIMLGGQSESVPCPACLEAEQATRGG